MKYFIIPLIFILICSCNDNMHNEINNEVLIINNNIGTILDSFAKSDKCNSCIHEIYIDKIDPHYYIIMIYKGDKSLTFEENNMNNQAYSPVTIRSGIKFRIFSGTEHYFNNLPVKNKVLRRIDTINTNTIKPKLWIVKDSFDVISIKKDNKAYPFFPLPVMPVD